MKRVAFFIFLSISMPLFAWNTNGHLLVTEIAYEHLTLKARSRVDVLTQTFVAQYPLYSNFQIASDWPDKFRDTGDTNSSGWHFINRPLNQDGLNHSYYSSKNVVWAIKKSEVILSDPHANLPTQAEYLMFLAHFVADVHQPLHTVTLYNKQFPYGDRGGNLYTIRLSHVKNLHQFWDAGGGFFYHYRHSNALSMVGVSMLAKKIQQDYPGNFFGKKVNNLNPSDWSYESYNLAKNVAYQTAYNGKPKKSYIVITQQASEQQIALAGYRLANVLNQLFK